MYKTYACPTHGEFDYECSINDGELKECPMALIDKPIAFIDADTSIVTKPNPTRMCNKPVIRVYKKMTYMDAEGFCGKCYT